MYIELPAYACHVFLDWREVRDGEGRPYGALATSLAGRGVPSVDEALIELRLRPVHDAFRAAMSAEAVWAAVQGEPEPIGRGVLAVGAVEGSSADGGATRSRDLEGRLHRLLEAVGRQAGRGSDPARDEQLARMAVDRIEAIAGLPSLLAEASPGPAAGTMAAEPSPAPPAAHRAALVAWSLFDAVRAKEADGSGDGAPDGPGPCELDAWRLGPLLGGELRELGVGEEAARRVVATVRGLLAARAVETPGEVASWFEATVTAGGLGVHEWDGETWFDREAFLDLVRLSLLRQAVELTRSRELAPADRAERLDEAAQTARALELACEASGHRVNRLLALLSPAGES
jgi:hypothetical protein